MDARADTGLILLEDGQMIPCQGCGFEGMAVGELCFTTGMTGYQETLTDPSFAQQIITFTSPHIGNTGTNLLDNEAVSSYAVGCILREPITAPSSWRSDSPLEDWLAAQQIVGVSGVDTRALTIYIRNEGAPKAVIAHSQNGQFDLPAARQMLAEWQGLENADLCAQVTTPKPYAWHEKLTLLAGDQHGMTAPASTNDTEFRVVVIDYGVKLSILRCLKQLGCDVEVVPYTTPAAEIIAMQPDGVFLSNGPGDPAATSAISSEIISALIDAKLVVYGICMGMQLLAISQGARTEKMHLGHRGANQPVHSPSGKVEITSQNHGFAVLAESYPAQGISHRSLFDGSVEGFVLESDPSSHALPAVAAVQYHPEAAPGPHDARPFFAKFVAAMAQQRVSGYA